MLSVNKQQDKKIIKLNSNCVSKQYTNIFKKARRTCKACLRGTATTKGSKAKTKS